MWTDNETINIKCINNKDGKGYMTILKIDEVYKAKELDEDDYVVFVNGAKDTLHFISKKINFELV